MKWRFQDRYRPEQHASITTGLAGTGESPSTKLEETPTHIHMHARYSILGNRSRKKRRTLYLNPGEDFIS